MQASATNFIAGLYTGLPTYKKILLTIGLLWTVRFSIKLLRGLNYFFLKTGPNLT